MEYAIKKPLIIDVSHWEAEIRWAQLSPKPDGVIIKASEYKWTDPLTKSHWAGATSIGVPRGLYHFYRPHDIAAQVSTFLSVAQSVGAYDGKKWLAEIPPVLDAEFAPPRPPKKRPAGYVDPPEGAGLASQYKAWLDLVETATKCRPMIYTSRNFWGYTLDWAGRPPAWTSDYDLWVGWYPDVKDAHSSPPASILPAGWNYAALWQYAEDGRIAGIPYDGVDLNLPADWFMKKIGKPVEPEAPAPSEPPAPPAETTWTISISGRGEYKVMETKT